MKPVVIRKIGLSHCLSQPIGRWCWRLATRDFKVTSDKLVNPKENPVAASRLQSTTDEHHQVINEKLISVENQD